MTRDEIIRLAVECQLVTTGNRDGYYMDALERFAGAVVQAELDALREQEPVAWATYPPTGCVTQSEAEAARWEHKGLHVTPLYAAPNPGDKATAAWADVQDATQWLEDLRGNTGEPT